MDRVEDPCNSCLSSAMKWWCWRDCVVVFGLHFSRQVLCISYFTSGYVPTCCLSLELRGEHFLVPVWSVQLLQFSRRPVWRHLGPRFASCHQPCRQREVKPRHQTQSLSCFNKKLGTWDCIYCASLSLSLSLRYAALIMSLMAKDCRYLLDTLIYNPELYKGNSYSIRSMYRKFDTHHIGPYRRWFYTLILLKRHPLQVCNVTEPDTVFVWWDRKIV